MLKILVVEDNPDARELLTKLLELETFEVIEAADAIEGLERAQSDSPDLIITDLSMPHVSGIELIRRLRGSPELRSIPILAVTSYGVDKAIEALKAGADRALARPVENRLLNMFVSSLLTKKA